MKYRVVNTDVMFVWYAIEPKVNIYLISVFRTFLTII